jgi:hypothetical protein
MGPKVLVDEIGRCSVEITSWHSCSQPEYKTKFGVQKPNWCESDTNVKYDSL